MFLEVKNLTPLSNNPYRAPFREKGLQTTEPRHKTGSSEQKNRSIFWIKRQKNQLPHREKVNFILLRPSITLLFPSKKNPLHLQKNKLKKRGTAFESTHLQEENSSCNDLPTPMKSTRNQIELLGKISFMYGHTLQAGPEKTPKSVKYLLCIILGASLLWAVSTKFLPYFAYNYLLHAITLSPDALFRGYIWQLFTYPFVQPVAGILSFNYLLDLAFKLYLTWVVGSSLVESRGEKSFLTLFFSGVAISGALTALFMGLTGHSQPFMGAHSPLYILLFAWMILNPYAKVYLFFTVPLNVTLVILGLWSCNLFLSLMNGSFSIVFSYFICGAYGYLYSVGMYQAFSPFLPLRSFESKLQDSLHRKPKKKTESRVYDFKTGKPLSKDALFMDAMLAKIAKFGKNSLTKEELSRMHSISKKSPS